MLRNFALRALTAQDLLAGRHSAHGHSLKARIAGGAAFVRRSLERRRQRRALLELDSRLLRDIGLTPADVRRECAKPGWQP